MNDKYNELINELFNDYISKILNDTSTYLDEIISLESNYTYLNLVYNLVDNGDIKICDYKSIRNLAYINEANFTKNINMLYEGNINELEKNVDFIITCNNFENNNINFKNLKTVNDINSILNK